MIVKIRHSSTQVHRCLFRANTGAYDVCDGIQPLKTCRLRFSSSRMNLSPRILIHPKLVILLIAISLPFRNSARPDFDIQASLSNEETT